MANSNAIVYRKRTVMEVDDTFGLVVHSFQKNDREQVRILINEYKDTKYLDIRIFYWDGKNYLPSKKGVTLKEDDYGDLLHGILQLGEIIGYNFPQE